MDTTALLLSRIQFAFTISFHIIFPAFTIGLAAWLTVLEALHLKTGRPAYRVLFDFWLKIFGVAHVARPSRLKLDHKTFSN
jgi:cytochrome bd ubiquinol oxidase subunit I